MFSTIVTGIVERVTTTEGLKRVKRQIVSIAQPVPGREFPERISVFVPEGLASEGELVQWLAHTEHRGVRTSQDGPLEFTTNVSFMAPLSDECVNLIMGAAMAEASTYQMAQLGVQMAERAETVVEAPIERPKASSARGAKKVKA